MSCLCSKFTSTDGTVVITKNGCKCNFSAPGTAVLGWGAYIVGAT